MNSDSPIRRTREDGSGREAALASENTDAVPCDRVVDDRYVDRTLSVWACMHARVSVRVDRALASVC
jgi:hypothetical protein